MVEEDEFVVLSDIFGSKVSVSEVYAQIYLPFIETLLSKISERVQSNLLQQQYQKQVNVENIASLDEKKRSSSKQRKSGTAIVGAKRKDEDQSASNRFCELVNMQRYSLGTCRPA